MLSVSNSIISSNIIYKHYQVFASKRMNGWVAHEPATYGVTQEANNADEYRTHCGSNLSRLVRKQRQHPIHVNKNLDFYLIVLYK